MTDRRNRSAKERGRIFLLHQGICHMCKLPIENGENWDVSHIIPLALGGADDDSNIAPAHRTKCHQVHTAEVDVPAIARAKRMRDRHIGATPPSPHRIAQPPKKPGKHLPKAALPPRRLFVLREESR